MATKKSTRKKSATRKISAESADASSCKSSWGCKESGGCGYFLGFIGAAIYYLSVATGFWSGVLGILQAIVWPVFVVLKILSM